MNGAIRLDPENMHGTIAALLRSSLVNTSRPNLDKAIELKKEHGSKAWIIVAVPRTSIGQHEEAIKDLDKAIELTPQYPAATGTIAAWTKRGLAQYIEAIKDLDKAIELDENNTDAWNNLGWAIF